jgi:multiple sugar transport system ATP-binding protein
MNLVEADGTLTGFRPEHFLPRSAFGEGSKLIPFPFAVNRVENLGADRLVYGTLEPPQPPARVISRLPSTIEVEVQPGERHEFTVRDYDLKRFDRSTGRSLQPGQH